MKASEAWNSPLVLDDPQMQFFATVGESKLAASMLKAAVDDLALLKRFDRGEVNLPRGTTREELVGSEAWVEKDQGTLSFSDCVYLVNPDFDVAKLRRAILIDPIAALDRVRNFASFAELDGDDAPVLDATEEEAAAGAPPITVGRLGFALMNMLEGPEAETQAESFAFDETVDGMRMAA